METLSVVPKIYKPLSDKVSQVLDKIGTAEEIRRLRIDFARFREVLHTVKTKIVKDGAFSLYIFGSVAEGTTTDGLESDVDYVYCIEEWNVIQRLEDATKVKPLSLLLVEDETTKAGYAKLQCVVEGIPQYGRSSFIHWPEPFRIDCKDRVVFCRPPVQNLIYEVHGPAFSTSARTGFVANDHVCALRCQSWPECVKPWLTRPKHYRWPSEEIIEKLKSFCALVVPVGHPHSHEQDMEWRISLSLQERELMHGLNSTQHKCYILLKMIKKCILEKMVGEESLSSYILKTCIFYMAENTPDSFWVPANIIGCLHSCLRHLHQWIVSGNCPNYFIPKENMLDRLKGEVIVKVKSALETLISADFMFLPYIRVDGFGSHLDAMLSNLARHQEKERNHDSMFNMTEVRDTVASLRVQVNFSRNELLHKLGNPDSADDGVKSMFELVADLKRMEAVHDHTREETHKAVSYVLPYIELGLVSNIVAKAWFNQEECLAYLTSKKWNDIASKTDTLSAKLKQATFLHMMGHYKASLSILLPLEALCGPTVISICHCREMPIHRSKTAEKAKFQNAGDLYYYSFIPCVVFLPGERNIIPEALVYEMMRSNDMPEDSSNKRLQYWFDWAVVDGKVLLYFLLYLNHIKVGDEVGKQSDIENLTKLIKRDETVSHKETALNLLGWAFKQEECLENAVTCFEASLCLHNMHNAATHHLKVRRAENVDKPTVLYSRNTNKL